MTQAQPFRANQMVDVARAWPRIPAQTSHARARQHPITGLWLRTRAALRGIARAAASRPRSERPYYPPRRESFIEDAAMAREMLRL